MVRIINMHHVYAARRLIRRLTGVELEDEQTRARDRFLIKVSNFLLPWVLFACVFGVIDDLEVRWIIHRRRRGRAWWSRGGGEADEHSFRLTKQYPFVHPLQTSVRDIRYFVADGFFGTPSYKDWMIRPSAERNVERSYELYLFRECEEEHKQPYKERSRSEARQQVLSTILKSDNKRASTNDFQLSWCRAELENLFPRYKAAQQHHQQRQQQQQQQQGQQQGSFPRRNGTPGEDKIFSLTKRGKFVYPLETTTTTTNTKQTTTIIRYFVSEGFLRTYYRDPYQLSKVGRLVEWSYENFLAHECILQQQQQKWNNANNGGGRKSATLPPSEEEEEASCEPSELVHDVQLTRCAELDDMFPRHEHSNKNCIGRHQYRVDY